VGIQHFKDDRGLTQDEIATIVRWAESGAPLGDLADMPPPRQFEANVYAWQLEKEMGRPPDLIVPMPDPFVVPGNSPNLWMNPVSETGLTEDRWIMAYETKPSVTGFPVVHHASTSFAFPDGRTVGFGQYALGKTGDIYPAGTGQLIKAGTKVEWNIHYSANPSGEDTEDQTSLAFWFYPEGEEPTHILRRRFMGGATDLDFPPGDEWVRSDGFTYLHENVRLTTFQPHLHNLGARQCMNAIYPDGRSQTLSCANWDFGWHIPYQYSDDVQPLLPRGTVIHVISWHNNSESNPWAYDPRNWVGWGNRSTDDMSFAHVSFYALTDEEFAEHVRERFTNLGIQLEGRDVTDLDWWPQTETVSSTGVAGRSQEAGGI
jgi:hypothetical protein